MGFGGLRGVSGFGDSVGEGGFGKRGEIRERERGRERWGWVKDGDGHRGKVLF